MYTISWEQIRYATSSSHLLSPGDVIFLSDHHTTLRHRNIHAWQRLATLPSQDENKDYRIYHAALVAAHPKNPNILTIAESTTPTTRIVSLEKFYQDRSNGTIMIFRSTIPIISHWLGVCAFHFASQKIPYFNVLESLCSCGPRKQSIAQSSHPRRVDCGSFVSFIHDAAIRTIKEYYPYYHLPTRPMQYREVAPVHLYHEIQNRMHHERSWLGVYCAEPINK